MKRTPQKFGMMLLILGLSCQQSWALSLGPALFMVQHVKPGQPLSIKEKSGVVYTVTNSGNTDGTFALECKRPVEGGVLMWEHGYDEIPDASWCRLDKEEFIVPARSKVDVGLTISVPDKPEYYNCKWIVAVVLKAGKASGIGVGLSVAARVQIETARSDETESGGGSSICAIPCALSVEGQAGKIIERSVILKNNTGRQIECVTQRLEDYFPNRESRYPRYASFGYRSLEKESWLRDKDEKFSLKPGEKREFKVKIQIPDSAKAGQKFEELVFVSEVLSDLALEPEKKGPARRSVQMFFRILYDVVGN